VGGPARTQSPELSFSELGFWTVFLDLPPLDSALGTVIEKPLLLAIMPRVCVDKQTPTTAAIKKRWIKGV
jgi:hypothetical protein